MKFPFRKSDSVYLLAFFIITISIGALLLRLPGTAKDGAALAVSDAFFTAASSVCNAGLSTIDLSGLTRRAQIIVLLLIQTGGLGIIAFSVILLTIPGHHFTLSRRSTIQGYYLDGVEYEPRKIVRNIVLFTLGIELLGVLLLFSCFTQSGVESPLYNAVFHSVSAFCNTGLSVFPTQLDAFSGNTAVIFSFSLLILLGGIGFIVLHDILRNLLGRKCGLSYHSKVVLGMTALIIVAGTAFFYMAERGNAYKGLTPFDSLVNALFQTINPRSGGFEVIVQKELSQVSLLVTGLLMLAGGAPGSIAGGIRLTTIFVLFCVIIRKPDADGDINIFHRRIVSDTIHKSVVYLIKALLLLFVIILMLILAEGGRGFSVGEIAFEAVSAFGTVGLSLGVTAHLSLAGKWILIFAMFAGRVGLVALAFPLVKNRNYEITYPEASLLLG